MDCLHFCRNNNKMAEINVPACPIPIHQTKLMIANPQPTGTLTPQIPVPINSNRVMLNNNSITSANDSPKPINQPNGVFLARTMELILSVTDAKVWPGWITGGCASICSSCSMANPEFQDSDFVAPPNKLYADACSVLREFHSFVIQL